MKRNVQYIHDLRRGKGNIPEWTIEPQNFEVEQDCVVLKLSKGQRSLQGNPVNRSEIGTSPRMAKTEGWYGFSMIFPEATAQENQEIGLMQFQSQPDKGFPFTSPCVMLKGKDKKLKLDVRWSDKYVSPVEGQWGYVSKDLGKIPTDKVLNFVVYYKAGFVDGVIEIWCNHKLLIRHIGSNRYATQLVPYFKTGMYIWGVNNSNLQDRYIKMLPMLYIGGDSYEDVYPGDLNKITTVWKYADDTQRTLTVNV